GPAVGVSRTVARRGGDHWERVAGAAADDGDSAGGRNVGGEHGGGELRSVADQSVHWAGVRTAARGRREARVEELLRQWGAAGDVRAARGFCVAAVGFGR